MGRLIGMVCLCSLFVGCGFFVDEGASNDEWVLMMAERHPAIADITELDSAERVAAYRSGGSTSLSYQSGVTHLQLFAPRDGNGLHDVLTELTGLLTDAGYVRGSDVATGLCFSLAYRSGATDHVLMSVRSPSDETLPDSVHLSIRGGPC